MNYLSSHPAFNDTIDSLRNEFKDDKSKRNMNLIGSCCISSHLLRLYGFGNTNPFAWTVIDFESFYTLLTDYDNIDWQNIEFSRGPHPWRKNVPVFYLTIDGKVKICFPHMLFDPNAKQPTKRGADVFYCKIWELIVQKYQERLNKMLDAGKPSMFIAEWEERNYDESAFEKLLGLDLKYKVVVITYNEKLKDVKKDNLLVIYDPHGRGVGYKGAGNRLPEWYAETYKDTIRKFLEK